MNSPSPGSRLRISTSTRLCTLFLMVTVVAALTIYRPMAAHRARLSLDLEHHLTRGTTARTRVIVSGSDADVDGIAARHHLQIVRRVTNGAVVLANSVELDDLSLDRAVGHLAGDARVRNWLAVSNQATAADQVRAGYPGLLLGLGAIAPVNGKNIGVAVVDSGIAAHTALTNKVAASVSFVTGDVSTNDDFGHGTHVAGIIAGQPTSVTPLYGGGIAPGANLINVRVLGDDGTGYVSDVIDGIEWVINHRLQYNIRVINLSLGHAVYESCDDDLLCQEVGKAVQQYGLVVVTAAGNYGRADDGRMILGGITSPGNSPYAITVGATNTWSTAARSDDTVATFSSRGPSPIDMTVKPDLAAPGVHIVSLQAKNSWLGATYPTLHVAGTLSNQYMTLSGTSMAAPMVSGAVALLLQGNPALSPSQVKLALQNGATYMTDGGLMGAGAGNANFWASRKIASTGLVANLLNTLVAGLSVTSSGASFFDAGTLQRNLYAGTGIRLLSTLLAPLAWLTPNLLNFGQLNLLGTGNPLANVVPKYLLYGTVAGWTNSQTIIWGTQINDPQGQTIIWGTSSDGDTIIWGTGTPAPNGQ
ncbi:MAG TPA: S8 family peptidase [Vicinamibacterales bacterium]|nr:S8 family peptidase [Vicinamibacterales bacterium]